MSSFQNLSAIVESLLERYDLDYNAGTELRECVTNLQYYYKNYLKYEIRRHSDCKHHCYTYSLSQPFIPNDRNGNPFHEKCPGDHEESCFHCENLINVINGLHGAIDICFQKGKLDKITHREYKMDVDKAYSRVIFKYSIFVCTEVLFMLPGRQ